MCLKIPQRLWWRLRVWDVGCWYTAPHHHQPDTDTMDMGMEAPSGVQRQSPDSGQLDIRDGGFIQRWGVWAGFIQTRWIFRICYWPAASASDHVEKIGSQCKAEWVIEKDLGRRRDVMIVFVHCVHPINPLTIRLLLKAEIIHCSTLRKRVHLHNTSFSVHFSTPQCTLSVHRGVLKCTLSVHLNTPQCTLSVHFSTLQSLRDVTQATLIARIIYAAPAWWRFLNVAEKDRIESVINKAKRYG